MGSLFSSPKKPDTSAQTAALASQEARIKADELKAAKQQSSSMAARRARTSGRASLLSGTAQGVTGDLRTTIG